MSRHRSKANRYLKSLERERKGTLKHITDFLEIASDCLQIFRLQDEDLFTTRIHPRIREGVGPFIKSLCSIHALYGYPVDNSENEGKS